MAWETEPEAERSIPCENLSLSSDWHTPPSPATSSSLSVLLGAHPTKRSPEVCGSKTSRLRLSSTIIYKDKRASRGITHNQLDRSIAPPA